MPQWTFAPAFTPIESASFRHQKSFRPPLSCSFVICCKIVSDLSDYLRQHREQIRRLAWWQLCGLFVNGCSWIWLLKVHREFVVGYLWARFRRGFTSTLRVSHESRCGSLKPNHVPPWLFVFRSLSFYENGIYTNLDQRASSPDDVYAIIQSICVPV